MEKIRKSETITVSVDTTDSVGESVMESVVKSEPLDEPNSSGSSCKQNQRDILQDEDENNMQEGVKNSQNEAESSNIRLIPNVTQIDYEEREKRQKGKPSRLGFANICTLEDDEMTFTEASSGPEKQQWLQAIAGEFKSFEDNQVWEIVDAPDNASVVQFKWVLKKKFDCDGKVRYRARLVAKGFTQKYAD